MPDPVVTFRVGPVFDLWVTEIAALRKVSRSELLRALLSVAMEYPDEVTARLADRKGRS
jgi:hypothetical protein